MTKNADWTPEADAVCLLNLPKYQKAHTEAKHGKKVDTKFAFCRVMKSQTNLLNERTELGLQQHMDYLYRILIDSIDDEKIKSEYKYLKGLWVDVDLNTVSLLT